MTAASTDDVYADVAARGAHAELTAGCARPLTAPSKTIANAATAQLAKPLTIRLSGYGAARVSRLAPSVEHATRLTVFPHRSSVEEYSTA